MERNLSSLLSPFHTSDFQKHFLTSEPFVVHGKELDHLLAMPFLTSLEALLNAWPSSIQVHLPELRDEISSLDTDSEHAMGFFHQGMGLLFNDVQKLDPALEEWLRNIAQEMGISKMTYGRNLLYATPDGVGTAPHFDQNINFVLQLHGTKKWKVAKNQQLKNPLTRHTMGQPADPELASYLHQDFPTEMPEDAEDFELRPGSLLFVPRGAWHSTLAEGDALALNFTFTAPAWVDLFTAALRSRLIQSEEWRETADLHTHKFDQLLLALVQDLPHWRASSILEATET